MIKRNYYLPPTKVRREQKVAKALSILSEVGLVTQDEKDQLLNLITNKKIK